MTISVSNPIPVWTLFTAHQAFWFLSLTGGGLLLSYAIWRRDPVFILGPAAGLIVYSRNLCLIRKERKRTDRRKVLVAEAR